ncbi:DUF2147 domain-containing protein [Psychromonas sp. MME2]|uniref:DUF2147 domain-containing protein n=1 Tax=unclassified Psychromonas TaxID=2614957 RepID=UPI00339D1192
MTLKYKLPLCFSLCVAANAFGLPLSTEGKGEVYGLWLERDKQKVAVLVEDCQGQLCGKIVWLKKPYKKDGKPKLDSKNPDKARRNTPRCGLTILSGFTAVDKNHWRDGTIYNPSDGDTYRSTIELTDQGELEVRGYVGIPFFGITTHWIRPNSKLQWCNSNWYE